MGVGCADSISCAWGDRVRLVRDLQDRAHRNRARVSAVTTLRATRRALFSRHLVHVEDGPCSGRCDGVSHREVRIQAHVHSSLFLTISAAANAVSDRMTRRLPGTE